MSSAVAIEAALACAFWFAVGIRTGRQVERKRRHRTCADADAIVGLLAERPWLSGYELSRELDLRPHRLYVALGFLEHRGRLQARWTGVTGDGPRARQYRLVDHG